MQLIRLLVEIFVGMQNTQSWTKKHVVTINLSVVFVSWYMWALFFFYSHVCKNLNNKNINIKKLLGLLLRALHLSNVMTS